MNEKEEGRKAKIVVKHQNGSIFQDGMRKEKLYYSGGRPVPIPVSDPMSIHQTLNINNSSPHILNRNNVSKNSVLLKIGHNVKKMGRNSWRKIAEVTTTITHKTKETIGSLKKEKHITLNIPDQLNKMGFNQIGNQFYGQIHTNKEPVNIKVVKESKDKYDVFIQTNISEKTQWSLCYFPTNPNDPTPIQNDPVRQIHAIRALINKTKIPTLTKKPIKISLATAAVHKPKVRVLTQPRVDFLSDKGKVTYVFSARYLANGLKYLSGFNGKEALFYGAGIPDKKGNRYIITEMFFPEMTKQNVIHVGSDLVSTAEMGEELDSYGLKLTLLAHIHPGSGPPGPSGTDINYFRSIIPVYKDIIGVIFTRDGFMRFFTVNNKQYSIEIFGKGVKKHGDSVYRLEGA